MSVAIADPAENGIALCLKRNDNGQMKYNLRTVSVLSIVRRKKYSYAKVDAGRRKISDRKLGNAFRINHCKEAWQDRKCRGCEKMQPGTCSLRTDLPSPEL